LPASQHAVSSAGTRAKQAAAKNQIVMFMVLSVLSLTLRRARAGASISRWPMSLDSRALSKPNQKPRQFCHLDVAKSALLLWSVDARYVL
jgi:hypothetical protein